MTKVLYSPGLGAGWSTWNRGSPEFNRWMLTYRPIIDALERDETLVPEEHRWSNQDEALPHLHPALQRFIQEAKEKFGMDFVYLGGADQLCVEEVSGPFRIDEYDGSESIVQASDQEWIDV